MAPNVFVIGAGPGVGFAVARRFLKEGYKVAIGSRNPDIEDARKQGFVPVKVDAAEQDAIKKAFCDVEKTLGPINVVIYNVAANYPLPSSGDPLSLPFDIFNQSSAIGSNFFAISKLAVEGFRKVASGPKTVISTGNVLPWASPSKTLFPVQSQKKAIAFLTEAFALRYSNEGFRFYFASQVTKEHGGVWPVDGDAHATAYLRLVQANEQLQWEQRFLQDGSEYNRKS